MLNRDNSQTIQAVVKYLQFGEKELSTYEDAKLYDYI
jgi:hypothetical protein